MNSRILRLTAALAASASAAVSLLPAAQASEQLNITYIADHTGFTEFAPWVQRSEDRGYALQGFSIVSPTSESMTFTVTDDLVAAGETVRLSAIDSNGDALFGGCIELGTATTIPGAVVGDMIEVIVGAALTVRSCSADATSGTLVVENAEWPTR